MLYLFLIIWHNSTTTQTTDSYSVSLWWSVLVRPTFSIIFQDFTNVTLASTDNKYASSQKKLTIMIDNDDDWMKMIVYVDNDGQFINWVGDNENEVTRWDIMKMKSPGGK